MYNINKMLNMIKQKRKWIAHNIPLSWKQAIAPFRSLVCFWSTNEHLLLYTSRSHGNAFILKYLVKKLVEAYLYVEKCHLYKNGQYQDIQVCKYKHSCLWYYYRRCFPYKDWTLTNIHRYLWNWDKKMKLIYISK